MKMGFTLVAGALVAAVLLAGFVLPKHVYVARRVVIDAPIELVYPDVSNLATWPEWTDWNTTNDPSYDPKPEGTSKLMWTKSEAGPGEQTITEADPAKGIKFKLELQGGRFYVEGKVQLVKDGTRTAVTWVDSMSFAHSYLGRYMGSTLDMMLGPRVAKSLLTLKQRAEERAKAKGVVAESAPQLPDKALTMPPDEPKPGETVVPPPPPEKTNEPKPDEVKQPPPPEPVKEPPPKVEEPPAAKEEPKVEPKPEPKPEPKVEEPKPEPEEAKPDEATP